jgi:hypothetical protein
MNAHNDTALQATRALTRDRRRDPAAHPRLTTDHAQAAIDEIKHQPA